MANHTSDSSAEDAARQGQAAHSLELHRFPLSSSSHKGTLNVLQSPAKPAATRSIHTLDEACALGRTSTLQRASIRHLVALVATPLGRHLGNSLRTNWSLRRAPRRQLVVKMHLAPVPPARRTTAAEGAQFVKQKVNHAIRHHAVFLNADAYFTSCIQWSMQINAGWHTFRTPAAQDPPLDAHLQSLELPQRHIIRAFRLDVVRQPSAKRARPA